MLQYREKIRQQIIHEKELEIQEKKNQQTFATIKEIIEQVKTEDSEEINEALEKIKSLFAFRS